MSVTLDVLNISSPDCTCSTCVGACCHKPGWFLPGEAERVAEHLGVALDELFTTKLAVDYHLGGGSDHTFVLSPVVVGNEPGEEFPFEPRGRCIFLDEGRCQIHAVKPFECRATHHADSNTLTDERHTAIARAWEGDEHQQQIRTLLGRKPEAEEGEVW